MQSDFRNLEELAKENERENWAFRSFLKFYDEMSDEQIDALVFRITDKIWSATECTKCARCCMKLQPILSEKDQKRLAGRLKMTVEQLRQQYLVYDEADDEAEWKINNLPCPFLLGKKCTVYEDRPDNCRAYPYLYEPDFTSRTWGMIERTFTCPIVFRVVEELKAKLDFH